MGSSVSSAHACPKPLKPQISAISTTQSSRTSAHESEARLAQTSPKWDQNSAGPSVAASCGSKCRITCRTRQFLSAPSRSSSGSLAAQADHVDERPELHDDCEPHVGELVVRQQREARQHVLQRRRLAERRGELDADRGQLDARD